ncbi:MAG: MFS transporter [Candidatus Micrarchaeia archaeon]
MLTKRQIEETKRYSILDGSAWSVMNGLGYTYFNPFLIALGASNLFIGLAHAFATLASALSQYIGGLYTGLFNDRKRIIVRFVVLHALGWLPLVLLCLIAGIFTADVSSMLAIVFYFIIIFLSDFAGPAWISVMGDVISSRERAEFFGYRNRIIGFISMASSVAGGIFLGWMSGNVFVGFATLFILAFIFRMISAYFLSKHHIPSFRPKKRRLTFILKSNPSFRNFVGLVSGILLATSIASPFFAVYMLRDLKFDYASYAILVALETVVSFISVSYWGKVISKYGTKMVLYAGALFVSLVPLLWLSSVNKFAIALFMMYSGFMWSGFNLAVFNHLIVISPSEERHLYAGMMNSITALASFAGSLVGALVAMLSSNISLVLIGGIQIVFLVSGISRLAICTYFLPKLKAGGLGWNEKRFMLRALFVYPPRVAMLELYNIYSYLQVFEKRLIILTGEFIDKISYKASKRRQGESF